MKVAANNFSIKGTMKSIMKITIGLLQATVKVLIIPFKKMTKQNLTRKELRRKNTERNSNIGQDLDDTDTDEENSFTASNGVDDGSCGWYKNQWKPTQRA